MTKRHVMVSGVLVCSLSLLMISGCRAFNSSYASPDAIPKKPAETSESKPAPKPTTPAPSDSAPAPVDYTKDTTECKTPEGVTVGKNESPLFSNYGWALPVDGEKVTVTAVKKGLYSATITIQKDLPNQSSNVLSFVVKQTAKDKFSACNFSYIEGNVRVYQGVAGHLMIDRVNAVGKPESLIVNSGSFDLTMTRAATASETQKMYLGATLPTTNAIAGISMDGIYFVDVLSEAAAK